MLHEKSCGAIVYRKSHGNIEILLIKHVNSGHWSFPKGHVEGDETEVETAEREIREETGIEVNIDPTFRETVSYSPKRDTQKVVVYFLAKAKTFNFVPQEEEIAEIRWVDIVHAGHVLTYENDKTIVTKARKKPGKANPAVCGFHTPPDSFFCRIYPGALCMLCGIFGKSIDTAHRFCYDGGII